jgi:ribosomal protein L28
MKSIKYLLILSSFILSLSSCKKDEVKPEPNTSTGQVNLMFDAFAGNQNLVMGQTYTNGSGETFKVTMFQYYVSNIKFYKEDGTAYTVPLASDSGYYLVKEDRTLNLGNIPAGKYTSVEFILGVDSLRNTLPVSERGGDLDVGNTTIGGSMYWSWNSGYIFTRFEGVADAVPDSTKGKWVQDASNNFVFDTTQYTYWEDVFNIHIGGFGGYSTKTNNNNRTVKLNLSSAVNIEKQNDKYEVHIAADVLKIMDGKKSHSFTSYYQEHSPLRTGTIADNCQNMFSIHHVEKQ